MTTDVNEFLDAAQSVPSFKFDAIGATVTGTIVSMDVWDQTEFGTGETLKWEDGTVRKQVVITLQTKAHEDDEDDGKRRIFAKQPSSMLRAINEARNGAKLAIGGTLAVKFDSEGEPPRKGFNAQKLFKARYTPPVFEEEESEEDMPF